MRTEEVEAAPQPRPFWPWLLLLLVLVLGGLAAAWYFTTRDEQIDAARIPDVIRLQRAEAEQRLHDREFEVEIERVVSDRAIGTVVAQRPPPGRVYGEGGIVVLAVARDPLKVETPDVTGLPVARALARLRAAELKPSTQTVTARVPKGRVVRQIPRPGTEVPVGSPAVVTVSSGQQLATVPDVVGLSSGEATAQLTQAGYRTQVNQVPGTQPQGTVTAQAPAGGTRAPSGRVVRINVSRGPGGTTTTTTTTTATTVTTTTGASARVSVPNTVGQDETTASSTLEGAGFRVRVVDRPTTDPSEEGIVLQQTPPGGRRAARGSTVTIFVGILR